MIPRPKISASCLPGCPNERQPHECCCRPHWAKVPRELKVELWGARREASSGRGFKNNGKKTKRWEQAFRAIIGWLMQQRDNDVRFATEVEKV